MRYPAGSLIVWPTTEKEPRQAEVLSLVPSPEGVLLGIDCGTDKGDDKDRRTICKRGMPTGREREALKPMGRHGEAVRSRMGADRILGFGRE